jgi:isocitrate dehydrogenase
LAKEAGKFEIVFTPKNGGPEVRHEVFDFPESGIGMAMYNLDSSIKEFAH